MANTCVIVNNRPGSRPVEESSSAIMETGGSMWLKLPTDLKVDILGRIPKDRELISLKVICKDWKFVISKFCAPNLSPPSPCARFFGVLCFQQLPDDVDKISKYLTPRLMPTLSMLGHSFQIERSILSLILSQEGEAGYIRDCCNGMILIASSNSSSQYYVGNPLTGQRFPIPVNPNRSTIHCSLVFDPSILLSDDKDPFFKIISFVRPAQQVTVSHPMEVDIYSSDKGEWCSHIVDLEPHQLYGFGWLERSVYFNRALYSLSFAMCLVCIDNVIPAPNSGMQDLKVWTIALPDKDDTPTKLIPNPGQCGCIGTCSGRFYYSNRNVQGSCIFVWMLGNSEWVLMHNINIRADIGVGTSFSIKVERLKILESFRPSVFYPNDEDGMVIIFVVPVSYGSYISYNVKTKRTLWHFVNNTITQPWKYLKVDGNCFYPLSPCPLLFSPSTET
ncbi:hypothetical protein OROHE_013256 [Orobanche hederae]